MELDRFRRHPPEDELARRQDGLDNEQRGLLHRWGYPHVLHRWSFHMTLSDTLSDSLQREQLRQEASAWFGPALAAPLHIESVALFEEAAPGAALECIARFALKR
jgi:hypothetical protein